MLIITNDRLQTHPISGTDLSPVPIKSSQADPNLMVQWEDIFSYIENRT